MYTLGIITSSDKGYKGERNDESGKVIAEIAKMRGFEVKRYIVLPDEKDLLRDEMIYQSDELSVNLILTTGGTGFSHRDVTPEATNEVIERLALGIPEAIRSYSMLITKRAMLSRATAGIRGETLIVNMPGSPKACREVLDYILEDLKHGIDILKGDSKECARK
ncbi:MAG: MogA/MoaB family molybdenum cofactor biosynthesis protein [Clostridium sp.]|uniref:MogA/MoaB family molybdenum cofactor biosynthesis protein n=1 Tax=Clostridium TaxID=1485 RepID=UPI0021528575|nr:MogA/MoaB family molybdenum cofactor biosynthesis protein [Clostridium sp. LY3-2]MCR6515921.1 MogA/MoaB family molybdenum cofactor biosynthesis protein [Clostridium sp. LY3-2]